MSDSNQVLAERGLRPRVRQTLQHAPLFALDHELPEAMRLLLARLEQVNGMPAEGDTLRPVAR